MADTDILPERTQTRRLSDAAHSGAAMTSEADLTSILVSRICHDLVSPVGAVVNGVDLVTEIGGGDIEAELAMISQSSNRASALLQYYRIAFGAASDEAEVSRTSLAEQASTFLATPRILLNWSGKSGPHLPRPIAKLLLQLLLCARGVAGMRAIINVNMPMDGSLPLEIEVQSERGPDAPEMLARLAGTPTPGEVSPRLVEFALARETVLALDLDLLISESESHIVLQVQPFG